MVNWYDGLTREEIAKHINDGTAPGSAQPGGCVEVPSDYLKRPRGHVFKTDAVGGDTCRATVAEPRLVCPGCGAYPHAHGKEQARQVTEALRQARLLAEEVLAVEQAARKELGALAATVLERQARALLAALGGKP